jgi:hypothetical protein
MRFGVSFSRVLSVLATAAIFGCAAYVPPQVTTDGLLAIKNGMSYAEVERLIGPPLCVVAMEDTTLSGNDAKNANELVNSCGPSHKTTTSVPQELRNVQKLSLSYAEPRAKNFTDPNIYVSFSMDAVTSVYIKKDDLGICCMEGLPTSPFYGGGSRETLRELIGR